ncbi:hypothetical protein TNCV_2145931 [Trichonephila clavipes]|uniref:Uncharacterized protein n=1 Tax=Trichonephila clavipes TaxID=2585209 RepID=A0A8X6SXQ5_TRICX|nr:hypothetical protein TNCV_2145931 [Trichonephila clavipes]
MKFFGLSAKECHKPDLANQTSKGIAPAVQKMSGTKRERAGTGIERPYPLHKSYTTQANHLGINADNINFGLKNRGLVFSLSMSQDSNCFLRVHVWREPRDPVPLLQHFGIESLWCGGDVIL